MYNVHVHTMINMREHTCTIYVLYSSTYIHLLVCTNVHEYMKYHVCFKFKSTKHS